MHPESQHPYGKERREENWLEAQAAAETVEGESRLPKLSADLRSPQGIKHHIPKCTNKLKNK